LVYKVPICKENQPIAKRESLGARLVNGSHNRLVSQSCQFLERGHNFYSGLAIESRGWLIKEYDFWVCNELNSNSSSFALSPRNELFHH